MPETLQGNGAEFQAMSSLLTLEKQNVEGIIYYVGDILDSYLRAQKGRWGRVIEEAKKLFEGKISVPDLEGRVSYIAENDLLPINFETAIYPIGDNNVFIDLRESVFTYSPPLSDLQKWIDAKPGSMERKLKYPSLQRIGELFMAGKLKLDDLNPERVLEVMKKKN